MITETVSGPNAPSLTTATRYDHDGNVYQVVRPAGDAVVTTYDLADEPLSTEVDTQTVLAATHQTQSTAGYDAAGNQTRATDYSGDTTTTSYDGDNRVVQSVAVTGTSTITTTPGYDPDGNALTTTTASLGVSTPYSSTFAYNANDLPVTTTLNSGSTAYIHASLTTYFSQSRS